MAKYTVDDICRFAINYRKIQKIKPGKWMLCIPIFGVDIYERALLEDMKRNMIDSTYTRLLNSSEEKQKSIIEEVSPVLDYYILGGKAM